MRGPLGLLGGKELKLERGPDCNCFERNQVDEFQLVIPGHKDCGSPITEVGVPGVVLTPLHGGGDCMLSPPPPSIPCPCNYSLCAYRYSIGVLYHT